MKFLTVAAVLHAFHDDVFGSHEREFGHDALFDDLRVNHKAIRDVFSDDEHRIHGEERFRNGKALVRAVVKRTFEPLRGLRESGTVDQGHHKASEGANAFAPHRVTLVSHGTGTDLGLFERFFHFLHALHQAHIGCELVKALRNRAQSLVHAVIPLAGISLTGDRQDAFKASLGRYTTVEFHDFFFVAVEEIHEACLRSGRTLHAAERKNLNEEVQFFEVNEHVLEPEASALANGRKLGSLEVRCTELRHILVFHRKLGKLVHHAAKTLANKDKTLLHLDQIGIVTDECGSRTQVNNALGLRALDAVSVDMAHHVMTATFFFGFSHVEVDIRSVSLQFIYLFLGNRKAEFHFGFGEINPEFTPSLELVLRAKDVAHFLRGITLNQRTFELITHVFSFPC